MAGFRHLMYTTVITPLLRSGISYLFRYAILHDIQIQSSMINTIPEINEDEDKSCEISYEIRLSSAQKPSTRRHTWRNLLKVF